MVQGKPIQLSPLLFAIGLSIVVSACSLVSGKTVAERKLIPGPCVIAYPSDNMQPPVTHEITAADGLTPMCLVALPRKPKRWKWSRDGSTLGYEIDAEQMSRSDVYVVNADGTGDRKIVAGLYRGVGGYGWTLSPDGQYIRTSSCSPSNCGMSVVSTRTGESICGGGWSTSPCCSYPHFCPPLKLDSGSWWSGDFPDIVLRSNDVALWDLLKTAWTYPMVSPNRLWMVGGASAGWYIASTDGKTIHWFTMPTRYSGYGPITCSGYPSQVSWRADSRRFAVFQVGSEKEIYVWEIHNDGSVNLADTIPFAKCPIEITFLADGTITTR